MKSELLPAAFAKRMQALLGDDAFEDYLKSFEEEWKPGLRANTLKISPDGLKELLPWELEPVPWVPSGFYYDGGQDRPSKHPAYYAGLYYLQEPSAMTPGEMLPVEPGDRVLDLCAAPGGKSTQLAARLEGEGVLVANDVSTSRARALLKNLELAGVSNILVTGETPERLAEAFPEFFDKILVDAPCSGEGMFRRNDEMVKDWADRGPAYYAPLQRQILAEAVKMLRPGGYLLYSTCTFSKEEDEGTVRETLERFPELELIPLDTGRVPGACGGFGLPGCMRLFPHRIKGEGHFLALMRKRGGENRQETAQDRTARSRAAQAGNTRLADHGSALSLSGGARPAARGRGAAQAASSDGSAELSAFLNQLSVPIPPERLLVRQEGVYLLPEGIKKLPSLRFLRTGLLLGELKKGRFEPSQALAMALKKGQFSNCVDLPMEDGRVIRYLKGETLELKPGEGNAQGWCLVCAGGFPLGWAKNNKTTLKNKYYPGWRWQ